MIKLYKARSLLYRRQILQVNIRWKALDEIYKIYMLFAPLRPQYFRTFSSNVFFAPRINLVDLVKSFPTNIFLQNLASIQQRTSLIKFDHSTEKSEKGSISNLSTKVAIVLAITSVLAGVPCRDDSCCTGEISLHGLVLPIGGVKEKVFKE